MQNIHESAIIEKGAVIGENVSVGAYAYIGSGVSIGKNTSVGHSTHIEGLTSIGEDNKIFPFASIGTAPQDLKYAGEPTRLQIGDRNTFREFCQVNLGTVQGGGVTKIANDCLFMGHTHIAHDCVIGDRVIVANLVALAGHVEIGEFSVIGGLSAVHQFVKIGRFAMVAGASALSQDAPPFSLVEGNRAYVRGLNLVGLRRHFDHSAIDELKTAFKEIFRKDHAPKSAAERLLLGELSVEARELCEFIVESRRGIPHKSENLEEV
ncbi:acyl-[acyl-carrier-protein]--UDP-N-acetylglucosamine O-acyltransferase [Campylobacterota bacterium]|nr:acyl-[acyl-carrier-protein]--UDP-N-acetylglucosamine O-acyltransferase [Campylobacterota bacterium]